MSINKHLIVAVIFLLSSVPAFAAEPWHVGFDLMFGRSSNDVSNCRGDCAYIPDSPGDDSHLALGTTIEKNLNGVGLGATLRVYDTPGKGEAFNRMIDAFARLSLPMGSFQPYIGVGMSKQDYKAGLVNADGGELRDSVTAPLYVLGVEKRSDWGFWFVEVARTDDTLEVSSHRNVAPGVQVPVNAEFDIERTTIFVGASINIAK